MPELTVSEMLFDEACPHANMPPRQRESTPSARGCLSRLRSESHRALSGHVGQRLVQTYPVGLTGHPNRPCWFPTTAANYPVGRTVRNVGRTGATRGYPVGRTG